MFLKLNETCFLGLNQICSIQLEETFIRVFSSNGSEEWRKDSPEGQILLDFFSREGSTQPPPRAEEELVEAIRAVLNQRIHTMLQMAGHSKPDHFINNLSIELFAKLFHEVEPGRIGDSTGTCHTPKCVRPRGHLGPCSDLD